MTRAIRSAGRSRWWFAVLLVCTFLPLLAIPSGAVATRVFLGHSVYRLFMKGTNGYRLRLSSYENNLYHRISLTAENELGQYARYSVEGVPKNGRIDAVFPGLGEVVVAMQPTKVKELPPPKGCKLPKATLESGTFVGTIRFRGEKGFTSVEASRARGVIERSQRQECKAVPAPVTSEAMRRARPKTLPTHFTDLEIKAGSVVVNAEGVAESGKAAFTAKAHERRGEIGIVRVSPGVSSPGDLKANAELTQATVAPRLPYLGTATYSGPPQATGCPLACPYPEGRLSGSLRVPLPGLGVVPLTGPGVQVSLFETTIAY
jgi:hypothetical protein